MGELLLLLFLPCSQKDSASLICQKDSAVFLLFQMRGPEDTLIYKGQHESIRIRGTKLFHQIQSQAGTPRAGPVQKSHIGIQPNPLKCCGAVPGQQSIGKRKQGVYRIQRWPPAAASEGKILFLSQDQAAEAVKICLGGLSFQPKKAAGFLAGANDGKGGREL